jgi:hypothetical protein
MPAVSATPEGGPDRMEVSGAGAQPKAMAYEK